MWKISKRHCVFASLLYVMSLPLFADEKRLVFCADADNLPLSNQKREGYENKLADLIANDLKADAEYVWVGHRRGGAVKLLRERECNVILGLPHLFPGVLTSEPYYVSSYYFVTNKHTTSPALNLDDERLKRYRIGLEAIGKDGANTPVARSISIRGLGSHVFGYILADIKEGKYLTEAMIDDVEKRKIDVALLWGPYAGYFSQHKSDVEITPILSDARQPDIPFIYGISIATRKEDVALMVKINQTLIEKKDEIGKLLQTYAVPKTKTNEVPLNS